MRCRFVERLHAAGLECHATDDDVMRVFVPGEGGARQLFVLAAAEPACRCVTSARASRRSRTCSRKRLERHRAANHKDSKRTKPHRDESVLRVRCGFMGWSRCVEKVFETVCPFTIRATAGTADAAFRSGVRGR